MRQRNMIPRPEDLHSTEQESTKSYIPLTFLSKRGTIFRKKKRKKNNLFV